MLRKTSHNDLYIADAITARDLRQIYDYQIKAVIDLAANEPPAVLGRDIIYCRFPIADDGSNDDALLSAAILCLRSLLERDYRTLVTCSAGMSRSPLVAAAAISRISGNSLRSCLEALIEGAPRDVSPTLFTAVGRIVGGLSESDVNE